MTRRATTMRISSGRPLYTPDGLHCTPPSPALQSIFRQLRRKSLWGRVLLHCIAALQSILTTLASLHAGSRRLTSATTGPSSGRILRLARIPLTLPSRSP
jgi:hypothetical protein